MTTAQLTVLFEFLGAEANNLKFWRSEKYKDGQRSKKHLLSPRTQLLVTLCRLRVGLLLQDLAFRLSLSVSYLSRMINSWIVFMYDRFKILDIFPERETISSKKPKCYRRYKNLRVVIDCFEVRTQSAIDYREKGNMYSTYKSSATFTAVLTTKSYGKLAV